jgi:hypothetical protein
VAPESLGSGYFAIIFSDGQSELTRQMVPLAAAVVPLGTAITDAGGSYSLTLAPGALLPGTLRATFAGTADAWPARAER